MLERGKCGGESHEVDPVYFERNGREGEAAIRPGERGSLRAGSDDWGPGHERKTDIREAPIRMERMQHE